jgi:hypothetical protein
LTRAAPGRHAEAGRPPAIASASIRPSAREIRLKPRPVACFALAALLLVPFAPVSRAAGPAITRVQMPIGDYGRLAGGAAGKVQIHVPLLIVAQDAQRGVSTTSGSVPQAADEQALIERVQAGLREPGAAPNAAVQVLQHASTEAGQPFDAATLRYPAVILIRLQAHPETPDGRALNAERDDQWQRALERWYSAGGHDQASLVIVSLLTGR